ncbi:SDR family oxidoreductase [Corynebacterium sp. sy039]|uniref:SDR family oxidoreductase n=1 Tax=Corynebacterium sp. sy039 TaxID=2599641 RepID=UPI0011B4E1CF|nr:SDR family oxidoreductase [Corynebacterium sp. sy039]QDZ43415.1 SDR family oxidoreductase [Corynebacterium sp. sy039]
MNAAHQDKPKTIVITGASQGVGLALTQLLATRSWHIHAQYRSAIPELDADIAQHITWWQADFSRGDSIAIPQVDTVDALNHCAGVAVLGACAHTAHEQWAQHMNINFHAPINLTNALLPQLRHAHGHVVYINSGAGLHTHPQWGAYSASKHAARAWCEALRQEEPQLRVSSIYPGRIDTQMQRSIVAQEGKEYHADSFLRADTVAKSILHLLDTPHDGVIHDLMIRPHN